MVSIIIPTYKGSSTILLAVLSSLNQTYSPIEVIVVDDNGMGTEEQIKTERVLSPYIVNGNIKYIVHSKNKNGSAARNTGIAHSSGDYLTFLDDDDFIFAEKIEKQVKLLESLANNYGLVYCGGYYVDRYGKGYLEIPKARKNPLVNYMTERIFFNTSAVLTKRKIVDELNGFDESFRRHQDWEFCARIIYKYDIHFVKEPLIIKYRVARNEISDPDVTAHYANHYLEKMKGILENLHSNDRRKIVYYHYRRVALSYFYNKKFIKGLRYLNNKTNKPFSQLFVLLYMFICHVVRKLVHGSRKRTPSLDQALETLLKGGKIK